GGKTWRFGLDTMATAGDNHCAIGPPPDRRFYFSGIRNNGPHPADADTILVYASRDSGRTWQDTSFQTPWRNSFDRQFWIADDTRSRYAGRVYLVGHGLGRAADGGPMAHDNWVFLLWRSLRGGLTFERPI